MKNKNKQTLLKWEAPEFIKHPKGVLWFLLAGVGIFLLVLYAVMSNSWSMAIAFIVLAGVYLIAHHHEPKRIQIKVTNFGIQAGAQEIPYNQIKAFWIVYNLPSVKTLKLLTTDSFMNEITIQLDGQAPGELRSILMKHIPEREGMNESFVDTLIRVTKL